MAKANHHAVVMRQHSATVFIDMAAAKTVAGGTTFQPVIPPDKLPTMPWSPWGANNLFPQELTQDIETTGILNAIIDGKARFALCEGLAAAIVKRDNTGKKVIEKFVDDDEEINAFMEYSDMFFQTFGWMRDQLGQANGLGRLLLDRGKKKIIAAIRHDVTEMRFQKKQSGKINNVFLHADWKNCRGPKDTGLITVPLLDPFMPLQDLEARKTGSAEFAVAFKYPGWGKHYYSTPLWHAAAKWVKIAQGVPEMKAALYSNAMVLKYMVIINEGFWSKRFGDDFNGASEEEQEEMRGRVYDEIDQFLVGAQNAHKSIFVNGYRDPVSGNTWQDIEIKPINGELASDAYLPDSAAANSEIAFANLFNPAIIGASLPSGPYTNSQGGSNVRESVLLQIILHELERNNIARVMNIVKRFNGWDKRHKGLEFIIPATALTTLDTGGSTKPITLGAQPGEKKLPSSPQNN